MTKLSSASRTSQLSLSNRLIPLRLFAVTAALSMMLAPAGAQTNPSPGGITRSDALTALLVRTRPGEWIDVPNSRMARVVWNCAAEPCPAKGPLASAIHGSSGPSAIMSTWSGATLDTNSDSLIVWGGGHNDYYGNEVYAFGLKTLEWSRLSAPSVVNPGGAVDINADGTPVSTHTYDSLAFLPDTNEMFVPGEWGARQVDSPQSWLFNLAVQSPNAVGVWKKAALYTVGSVDTVAKYDPGKKRVFVINHGSGLRSYDPAADRWGVVGNQPLSDYHMTGAISSDLHILVATGNGFLNVINLTSGIVSLPIASGDLTAQKGNAPGLVWDPRANMFVAWNGGSTLYTLDPRTWQWTAQRAASTNTVVPSAPAGNGTFGRFQYDAMHDAFVVVNDINQDVYIFKPNFGQRPGPSDSPAGSNSSAPKQN